MNTIGSYLGDRCPTCHRRFHGAQVGWWAGLIASMAGAVLGQAELIGEPARHYVTIVFIATTAACGYALRRT